MNYFILLINFLIIFETNFDFLFSVIILPIHFCLFLHLNFSQQIKDFIINFIIIKFIIIDFNYYFIPKKNPLQSTNFSFVITIITHSFI
jgi:hypothetical protein